jgi:AcrR family transcriptional regulator
VREAVLGATVQELAEQGHGVLSLEAIARRAGVNKATLYRRWGGRDGLVLAAVEWYGVTQADVPDPGDFDQDLRHWARSIQRMLDDVTAGALVLAVFTGDRTTTRPIRHRFWNSSALSSSGRSSEKRFPRTPTSTRSSATSARPCTTVSWSSPNPSPSTTPTWQQSSPPVPLARASSARAPTEYEIGEPCG